MRYYIIFGITIIIAGLLFFYPKKYLHIYDKQLRIDYESFDKTDKELWSYEIDNDNLVLDNQKDKTWTFKANKDGDVKINFYYDRKEEIEKYKIEYIFRVKGNKIYWMYGNGIGLFDFPNPR